MDMRCDKPLSMPGPRLLCCKPAKYLYRWDLSSDHWTPRCARHARVVVSRVTGEHHAGERKPLKQGSGQ